MYIFKSLGEFIVQFSQTVITFLLLFPSIKFYIRFTVYLMFSSEIYVRINQKRITSKSSKLAIPFEKWLLKTNLKALRRKLQT